MGLEYYYLVNGCSAATASDEACICWHAEGDGPMPAERHDERVPVVAWRETPASPDNTNYTTK